MNYYSYRLMIRENHILKCRRLFHEYVVYKYVKIETERLTFIRFNQTKLRSEEYIHLRDTINTDGNAQNAQNYDIADLFITLTCNPWIEIKQELFSGQSPIDRQDITARETKVEIFNRFHCKTLCVW